ncbi:MAG TPA: FIST N-terminal domain-containing protein [Nitrospirota bacterium]|nr:FIST N-terminal domain-containing protein [Nitrospirota bacterium]
MGTLAGVGYSVHRNPIEAGREAAQKALNALGAGKPDIVFVFGTVGYNQQLLIQSIREATANAPLSGCSAEGIITQGMADETNFGVAVMAISSSELQFHNVCVKDLGAGAGRAGERLAELIQPHASEACIACFLFADGLALNFDPFLTTFERALHCARPLPIFGGLAADNWTSQKTYQYHNDEVFSDGISCMLLSGQGAVAWGVNHGCVPVGTKRTVTRSRGNEIFEIDGGPALEVLKEYSGEDWTEQWNKTSLNLCLGFKTPEHLKQYYDEYLIRYMNRKNNQSGSVTIQSDVREGTDLWIVRRDKELIRSGLQTIADRIHEQTGGRKPMFVLHFECVGRGKVVFRESEKIELIRALQHKIGDDIPWLGFYGYGEIGPIRESNCLHNFTAVVTAVY